MYAVVRRTGEFVRTKGNDIVGYCQQGDTVRKRGWENITGADRRSGYILVYMEDGTSGFISNNSVELQYKETRTD